MTRVALVIAAGALLVAACTSDDAEPREAPTAAVTPTPIAFAPVLTPPVESTAAETPTPTSQVPSIRFHAPDVRTGDLSVDAVIDAIVTGDAEAVVALVEVPVRPCVSGPGIHLFLCGADTPAATPVGRFNVSSCSVNGTDDLERIAFSLRSALDTPKQLHSVTVQPMGEEEENQHWIYFGVGTDAFDAATLWVSPRATVVGISFCGYPNVEGNWTFLLPPVE